MSKFKIRSTKFEIDSAEPSTRAQAEGLVAGRNNNKIQIFQFSKHVFNFGLPYEMRSLFLWGHLIFGFVWHFDIRISDLKCRISGAVRSCKLCKLLLGQYTSSLSFPLQLSPFSVRAPPPWPFGTRPLLGHCPWPCIPRRQPSLPS